MFFTDTTYNKLQVPTIENLCSIDISLIKQIGNCVKIQKMYIWRHLDQNGVNPRLGSISRKPIKEKKKFETKLMENYWFAGRL